MNFGMQMLVMRMLRQMSQEQLARAVGIARPYITGIENGKVDATPALEARIRKALDWPVRADQAFEILAGDPEPASMVA